MVVEQRGPAVCNDSNKKEGRGDMTKTPVSLQDLRRSLYIKAKAEPAWRFWGLCVHVCKVFAVGDSSECFSFVRDWVEKKVRGHLMRAREQTGFGWQRWSRKWLYGKLGLYKDYRLRRPWSLLKVQPVETVP